MNKTLLQEILAVPTHYRHTDMLVEWLQNKMLANNIPFYTDRLGNVYATKGCTSGFYPAVCSHTDSVHPVRPMTVTEEDGCFVAYGEDGQRIGIGGDDKVGVYVCVELLLSMPVLKAAFFVDEEIGCLGSRQADPAFFEDVGYCIEFDSPNNDILSFSCDGAQLCEENGALLKIAEPLLTKFGAVKWQWHPYTDVAQLRRKFDFECLNLPCGYYNMHSEQEYVRIEDTARALELGKTLIHELGCRRYFMPNGLGESKPERLHVTRLMY
jgi:putative aminopeptidase FrvX